MNRQTDGRMDGIATPRSAVLPVDALSKWKKKEK